MNINSLFTSNYGAAIASAALAVASGLCIALAPAGLQPIVLVFAVILATALIAHIGRRLGNQATATITAETASTPIPMATLWTYRLFVPLVALGEQTSGASTVCLVLLLALAVGPTPSLTKSGFSMSLTALLAISGMVWLLDGSLRALLCIPALVLLAAASSELRPENFPRVLMAILDSVAIYLWMNIIGYYVLGLRSPAEQLQYGLASSTVGFLDERLFFPFSNALLTPASMAAAFFAGYVATLRFSGDRIDLFRLASIGASIFILLAANGRTCLIAAVLVGLLSFIRPGALARSALAVALVMLVIPFWWPLFSSTARPVLVFAGENLPLLNRGDTEGIVTLQNRTAIWEPVKNNLVDADLWHLFVGWGANGQIGSGIYHEYDSILQGGLVDLELASAHNSAFQQILDSGLIGLGAMLVSLVSAFASLGFLSRRALSGPLLSAFAMVTAICVTSGTDVILTSTASQETFWLFGVISVCLFAYRRAVIRAPRSAVSEEQSVPESPYSRGVARPEFPAIAA